ncbi:MAG: hypothetical protein RR089_02695, partial [Acidaminococcaceae bacterium]
MKIKNAVILTSTVLLFFALTSQEIAPVLAAPPLATGAPTMPAPVGPGSKPSPGSGGMHRPAPPPQAPVQRPGGYGGSGQRPNPGSVQRPNPGSVQRPNPGSIQRPNPGSVQGPTPGSIQRPNPGSVQG